MTEPFGNTVPPFHVQSFSKALRDGFPYFAHHDSVSALWSRRWRHAVVAGFYPFFDGQVEDFDPIFAESILLSGDDPAILHRPDDYAAPFLPVGRRLASEAQAALMAGRREEAKTLFLRAAAVFRIARYPINRSPVTHQAWEESKAAYEQAGRLLDPPSVPVPVPFAHADPSRGDLNEPIQAYLRLPGGARAILDHVATALSSSYPAAAMEFRHS